MHTPTPLSPWQYQSFEPFGNKLHQSAPSQMIGLITHWTDRGFTGHEGVDKAGIIHMNGRIYDPAMGRFLQADPFIQEPDNTQSLNRYSYVINNPLSYTDPSGYFFNSVFSAVFRGIVTATGCSVGGPVGCGVAGFVSNIALGQTLRQSVINGAVTGLQGVAFDKVGALAKAGDINSYAAFAIHGAIGAASAAAQGGDVVSSLLTSGLSKAFSLTTRDFLASLGEDAVQVLNVAIVGGTVSALTGGKFGNGAFLAGFAYAVNQLQALAMATPSSNESPAKKAAKSIIKKNRVIEKAISSNPGESKNDFLKRVGMDLRALANADTFEHCGNVCANGSSTFVEVVTIRSHIGCSAPNGPAACPSGYTDSGADIHVHGVDKSVRANETDKAMLTLDNNSTRSGRIAGQDLNRFSTRDLSNGQPDYLYTDDGRLLYEDNKGNISEIK